ncbi:hypothetical protein [Xanthomonas phaseoli]|uniref:hypothetical protein n=1 Tax=Xanthomonas phaseoli TaxID=1985254 RepID=UPI0002D77E19|nr:hypothetical protein [Xanthomonas phaseoli]
MARRSRSSCAFVSSRWTPTAAPRSSVQFSSRTQQYETLRKPVEEFERAAGLELEDWQFQPEDFGKAVKFVLANKLFGAYHSIERLREQLRGVVVEMDKVAACYRDGTPYVPEGPVIKRRRAR